jgi:hypothetical protein
MEIAQGILVCKKITSTRASAGSEHKTSQVSWSIHVPALIANNFADFTNRTSKTKQGRLTRPLSNPPIKDVYRS